MNKRVVRGVVAILCMTVAIVYSKTVFNGAKSGIDLCVQTIIPAIFPFMILTGIINNSLLGEKISLLHPVRYICKIPSGTESILLLGFLGGYPLGAQAIIQAYQTKTISDKTAKRMLGFCNNAGPSFIFGILGAAFTNIKIVSALWLIHIVSALLVGYILPTDNTSTCKIQTTKQISLQQILKNSLYTMAIVCGWVIIFRIILQLLELWVFCRFSNNIKVLTSGLLELSNGCVLLNEIQSDVDRFIYAGIFIAFGGLCVTMQTSSVVKGLGFGFYYCGKLLQTLIVILLSIIISPFIFHIKLKNSHIMLLIWCTFLLITTISIIYRKKLWHLRDKCSIIRIK